MSEEHALDRARELATQDKAEEAEALLWPLLDSGNPVVKLNAIFVLLNVLDRVREGDTLLALTDQGIETASALGLNHERVYLLSQKVFYLLGHLALLIGRAKSLTMSARVFRWIEFALEREKQEYDAIAKQRLEVERDIVSTATEAESLAADCPDQLIRGGLFEGIAQYYSNWFLTDMLDLQSGGRWRAKIFNLRFVRRWNLFYFLYDRESRAKIKRSQRRCFEYFERALRDFELANSAHDVARVCYNFASKLMVTNRFFRAHRFLQKAKALADPKDATLMRQMGELEKRIKERNRNIPDYVEELGLDMP